MACVWRVDVVRRREADRGQQSVAFRRRATGLVLFEPLVFVYSPCPDAPDCESRKTVDWRGGGMPAGSSSALGVHSEMAEPFDCADGIAATAQTRAMKRLWRFADMH